MQHEELYLQDIVEAVGAIEGFLENVSESAFLTSDLLQSAVLQKLMTIGEAASEISSELKSRYPQTPWKQIVGFRNIAVHAYFTINLKIVCLRQPKMRRFCANKSKKFWKMTSPILNCETI